MSTDGLLPVVVLTGEAAKSAREYFCKQCKQLRLWARDGEVSACSHCGAAARELVVRRPGELTAAELDALRRAR